METDNKDRLAVTCATWMSYFVLFVFSAALTWAVLLSGRR